MSNKRWQKPAIIIGLGVVICIIAAVLVGGKIYSDWLREEILSRAQKHGLLLSFNTLQFDGLGLKAEKLELFHPNPPILLQCETATIKAALLPLLTGRLKFNLEANLYGGALIAEINYGIFSQSGSAKFNLAKINLALVPSLAGLGITAGYLDSPDINVAYNPAHPTTAAGNFTISGLQKPEQSRLEPWLTGLPVPVTVPPVRNLSASGTLDLDTRSLKIENFKNDSSLGKMVGKFESPRQATTTPRLTGQVKLSPEGQKFLGIYLPLISQGLLESNEANISFEVSPKMRPAGFKVWRTAPSLALP